MREKLFFHTMGAGHTLKPSLNKSVLQVRSRYSETIGLEWRVLGLGPALDPLYYSRSRKMSSISLLLVRCSDLSISAAHRERKATTSSVLNDSLPVHNLKVDIPDFQFFEIGTSENVGNR